MKNRRPLFARRLFVQRLEDRSVPSATAPDLNALPKGVEFDPGVILVRVDPGTDPKQLYAPADHLFANWYRVSLIGPKISVQDGLNSYGRLPIVNYVEPDYIVRALLNPNDPNYPQQYGLPRISAPTAWNVTTGTGNTVVGMIDSGIDYSHIDLAANMWHNPGEVPGDRLDNDGNGYVDDYYGYDFANNDSDPIDDFGHGTHTAGIVGAVGNNSIGVTGMNWKVQLMALKFLGSNGTGAISNAVKALNYATMMGVKITNNSWGGGGSSQAMIDALNAANSANAIFVAAAGNTGANNDAIANFPASYAVTNVVSVAATNASDVLASFSNYGATTVAIAAPGEGIVSTLPGNVYNAYNGTSQAAPYVTGTLALLRDYSPTWTVQQLIGRIYSTGDTLATLTGRVATGKRLNAGAALTGLTPSADVSGPRINTSLVSGSTPYNLNRLRLTFTEAINPTTFTPSDVIITGPNGRISSGVTVTPVTGAGNVQFDISLPTQSTVGSYKFVVGPDVRDMAGNPMDRNNNGINGENPGDQFVITVAVTQPPLALIRTYSSIDTPRGIPDDNSVTSVLIVPDSVVIRDINIRVRITHTYVGDLNLQLQAPNGRIVQLFNRVGGYGTNLTNTVFDDEATQSINNGIAPFSGSFRPDQPLSAFDGLKSKGTWKLIVADMATQDIGTLQEWSITITSDQKVKNEKL
ncbi:MAG: S8 family serine peptidase [Gemmataceae bacterium]